MPKKGSKKKDKPKAKAKPKPQPIKKYKSFLEYVPASDCFSDIDYSSIITDIDIWLKNGLSDDKISLELSNLLYDNIHKLAYTHIAAEKSANSKYCSASLLSELQHVKDNLMDAMKNLNDEELSYTDVLNKLYGVGALGFKISSKTGQRRGVKGWRDDYLTNASNQNQCKAALLSKPDERFRCWLCPYSTVDYKPGIKSERDGKSKSICPDSAIDCEHKLGIKDALLHLNLIQNATQHKKENEEYKNVIFHEYAWSHKCCNMIKLDQSMIKQNQVDGKYEPNKEVIIGILRNIYKEANKTKDNQKAYGCYCIPATAPSNRNKDPSQKSMEKVNQPENRDRVIQECQQICNKINEQIEFIRRITSDQSDLERRSGIIYQFFITFRFFCRATKKNMINALVSGATELHSMQIDFDQGGGGGKKKRRVDSSGSDMELLSDNTGDAMHDLITSKLEVSPKLKDKIINYFKEHPDKEFRDKFETYYDHLMNIKTKERTSEESNKRKTNDISISSEIGIAFDVAILINLNRLQCKHINFAIEAYKQLAEIQGVPIYDNRLNDNPDNNKFREIFFNFHYGIKTQSGRTSLSPQLTLPANIPRHPEVQFVKAIRTKDVKNNNIDIYLFSDNGEPLANRFFIIQNNKPFNWEMITNKEDLKPLTYNGYSYVINTEGSDINIGTGGGLTGSKTKKKKKTKRKTKRIQKKSKRKQGKKKTKTKKTKRKKNKKKNN